MRSMTCCIHCGLDVNGYSEKFCCHGCETVYNIIQKSGLQDYYRWLSESSSKAIRPSQSGKTNFTYLDLPETRAKYDLGNGTYQFFIEGIHCIACLWILERIPQMYPHVSHARLNFSEQLLTVQMREGKLSEVLNLLFQLGYPAHLIKDQKQLGKLQKTEEQASLARIGITAALVGNIMLLAVSNYAGADRQYRDLFNNIEFALFLPVATYSVYPLFRSAFFSLKSRSLNIDVPVMLAFLSGTILSLIHLVSKKGDLYFDSLSTFVLLLLSSRYIFHKIQQRQSVRSFLFQSLGAKSGRRLVDRTVIPSELIVVGEELLVENSESFPCDGKLISDSCFVDESVLTGETRPVMKKKGDVLFHGTILLSDTASVVSEKVGENTRLGQILANIDHGLYAKPKAAVFADKIGRFFTYSVLLVSGLNFSIYGISTGDWFVALNRALAFMIVTCPCVLAFIIPLTFSIAVKRAAKAGILIKGNDTLERVAQTNEVLLDKTGTLTNANMNVVDFVCHHQQEIPVMDLVYSLEKNAKHPVARALVKFALDSNGKSLELSNFHEEAGHGVSAHWRGDVISLKKSVGVGSVGLFRNDEEIGTFTIADTIRQEASGLVSFIKSTGRSVGLVTGDRLQEAVRVGGLVGISEVYADQAPEEKLGLVENHPLAMMVGDGANDSAALAKASVGVAVRGSLESSLKASDVYLARAGLGGVQTLILLAKKSMNAIHMNLKVTLFYNLVAGTLALLGYITPLWAAIIMPLSSLTVVATTYFYFYAKGET